jgi:hypothetical protein
MFGIRIWQGFLRVNHKLLIPMLYQMGFFEKQLIKAFSGKSVHNRNYRVKRIVSKCTLFCYCLIVIRTIKLDCFFV